MPSKVVDFGGGQAVHKDADINIDREDYPETGIRCDLDEGIPLDSNSVKKAYAHNVIEHLRSPFEFVEELIRVCEDGAEISVRFPVPEHPNAWKDPEHKYTLRPNWFNQFEEITLINVEEHFRFPALVKIGKIASKLTGYGKLGPDEYRIKARVA